MSAAECKVVGVFLLKSGRVSVDVQIGRNVVTSTVEASVARDLGIKVGSLVLVSGNGNILPIVVSL